MRGRWGERKKTRDGEEKKNRKRKKNERERDGDSDGDGERDGACSVQEVQADNFNPPISSSLIISLQSEADSKLETSSAQYATHTVNPHHIDNIHVTGAEGKNFPLLQGSVIG